MQQVLFRLPDPTGFFPDGIPVYGYGMMLFVTFIVCSWFARRHAARAGMTAEQIADLAIWLFFWGVVGGRVVFMIQYRVPASRFFHLWEGGLVVYGALIGGFIAYWVFYLLFLKKYHVSSWQLGDVAAPAICIGIALGRIGCLLNGCCYGGVAPEGCPALEFPLLTAPARESVVENHHYQTVVGFTTKEHDDDDKDLLTIVAKVEPGSAAEKSGVQEGDRIVAFNGRRNDLMLYIRLKGQPKVVDTIIQAAQRHHLVIEDVPTASDDERAFKVFASNGEDFTTFRKEAHTLAPIAAFNREGSDTFDDMIYRWPRGITSLQLTVWRGDKRDKERGNEIALASFTPRTIGLHPTQVYETISMSLLLFLLLAYYPFRRHNGQVFVLFMICYAIHRFLNEMLRDDTPNEFWFHMTLSQSISVMMVIAALVLEGWLRMTQPRRFASAPDPDADPPAVAEPVKQ
jgi:prolipoprotein diacylglyceryltransferase